MLGLNTADTHVGVEVNETINKFLSLEQGVWKTECANK